MIVAHNDDYIIFEKLLSKSVEELQHDTRIFHY